MRWAEPGWFLLFLVLPAIRWAGRRRRAGLAWPSIDAFFPERPRGLAPLDGLLRIVEALAFSCFILALARPQTVGGRTLIQSEGIAIVLVLDRSSSMNADDFVDASSRRGTRLDSAKKTIAAFLERRSGDLVGLVAFAGQPDLSCPPTLDHRFVADTVRGLKTAKAGDDGTNLGDALLWAADALRQTNARRRRLILLSDGRHAPQRIRGREPAEPIAAARLASELGITIDAVAVGDAGGLIKVREPDLKLDLVDEVGGPDVALLSGLARIGGGLFFHATDPAGLDRAFEAIDAEEKSKLEDKITTRYDERFAPFAATGAAALALATVLRTGRLRRLP